MIELLLCSIFTLLPDYLYRRYGEGKRIGVELSMYSVWYELRYGITGCLMLTVALITIVFYNHPSTSSAHAFFRTVPIMSETIGRVAEVNVDLNQDVKKGTPLFKLDSSKQQAAVETAKRRVAEVEAAMTMAKADLAAAKAQVQQAESAYKQAVDELETKSELRQRNADVVAQREIERLQNVVDGRKGGVEAAVAAQTAAEIRISTSLPAEMASAEAQREQAQVELNKTVIYAGVDGRVEQFVLRVGDLVNPMMRPAGVLVPAGAGRRAIIAGFGQIEGQIMKVGMAAEVACISKPLTIIPMVVTQVQPFISAGQFRAGEQLLDPQQITTPGTITVYLEPLFNGGIADVPPGSSCIANAYSNNHDELSKPGIGIGRWIYLHVVDTVSIVHAMILRLQALVLPIETLVLGGH
jgi:multidrug resistance efflux pump